MLVNNCREAFGENKVLFSLFSGDSDGKDSACSAGDWHLIPKMGRSPGEGNWQPTPVFLPGEFPGQRSLVGYSPRGRKESDMTERLRLHLHETASGKKAKTQQNLTGMILGTKV